MSPPYATEAEKARLTLAELANAARSAPVGPATVLAYVARLRRHVDLLAEYEDAADELATEALDAERARYLAIQSGQVIPFPSRPRIYTGQGGNAA